MIFSPRRQSEAAWSDVPQGLAAARASTDDDDVCAGDVGERVPPLRPHDPFWTLRPDATTANGKQRGVSPP